MGKEIKYTEGQGINFSDINKEAVIRKRPIEFENFKRRRRENSEFPLYEAQNILDNLDPERFAEAHNCLIVVDFSKHKEFRDLDWAKMCIEVMSSDARQGTLTHLEIPQFEEQRREAVKKFIDQLANFWGKGVPVCIVGGEDGISNLTLDLLKEGLKARGFILGADGISNDIGGSGWERQAILHPDKVTVEKQTYGGEIKVITLLFPLVQPNQQGLL